MFDSVPSPCLSSICQNANCSINLFIRLTDSIQCFCFSYQIRDQSCHFWCECWEVSFDRRLICLYLDISYGLNAAEQCRVVISCDLYIAFVTLTLKLLVQLSASSLISVRTLLWYDQLHWNKVERKSKNQVFFNAFAFLCRCKLIDLKTSSWAFN